MRPYAPVGAPAWRGIMAANHPAAFGHPSPPQPPLPPQPAPAARQYQGAPLPPLPYNNGAPPAFHRVNSAQRGMLHSSQPPLPPQVSHTVMHQAPLGQRRRFSGDGEIMVGPTPVPSQRTGRLTPPREQVRPAMPQGGYGLPPQYLVPSSHVTHTGGRLQGQPQRRVMPPTTSERDREWAPQTTSWNRNAPVFMGGQAGVADLVFGDEGLSGSNLVPLHLHDASGSSAYAEPECGEHLDEGQSGLDLSYQPAPTYLESQQLWSSAFLQAQSHLAAAAAGQQQLWTGGATPSDSFGAAISTPGVGKAGLTRGGSPLPSSGLSDVTTASAVSPKSEGSSRSGSFDRGTVTFVTPSGQEIEFLMTAVNIERAPVMPASEFRLGASLAAVY